MYFINVLIWSASFREELVSFCRGAIWVSPGLLGWALLRRGMRMLGLMVSSFWQATSPSFLQLLEPQPGHKEKEGESVSSNLGSSLRLYCKISSGVSICKKHRAALCVFCGLLKAASSTWQVLTPSLSVRSSSGCLHLSGQLEVSIHAELCRFSEKVKSTPGSKKNLLKFTFKSDKIKVFPKRILS